MHSRDNENEWIIAKAKEANKSLDDYTAQYIEAFWEDFELLFTVHPENVARLPKRVDSVAISHIGEIAGDLGVRISERSHVWELKPAGFEHFRQPE